MGFLATVVEFLRSTVEGVPTPEVKLDRGGDHPVTGYCFAPPGTDAPPLPGDVAYAGDDQGAGNAQALGYQDPKNAGLAAGGEHRLYARSPDGTIVGQVWLKGDGSILIANLLTGGSVTVGADGSLAFAAGAASGALGADGAISLSNAAGGLAINAAGNVVATTPLGTFGAGTHGHNSPFGPIGPPIPGT